MTPLRFASRLLRWHARHGRHDLPWQHPRTPYRVWVAEVMLQQTQVATVIPYYARFLARFPDIRALARAPLDDVLALWSGLGYYARARNLHRAAREIVARHDGEFPTGFDAVVALPGIGRSTAGAILAQAFGARHAILEGNARRVFARHAGIEGWPGEPQVAAKLWRTAEGHLPRRRLADYTQAVMDLGATVCTASRAA
jgi:A/G-specific adenine glycosylase